MSYHYLSRHHTTINSCSYIGSHIYAMLTRTSKAATTIATRSSKRGTHATRKDDKRLWIRPPRQSTVDRSPQAGSSRVPIGLTCPLAVTWRHQAPPCQPLPLIEPIPSENKQKQQKVKLKRAQQPWKEQLCCGSGVGVGVIG